MSPAPRWPNQDAYADLITSAAAQFGVPTSIAFGLIAQESGFNALAMRSEPGYHCAATGTTGDASYGLMQVLYCTAIGLGYSGTPSGLLDPATNVGVGMQLLGSLLQEHGGNVAAALSAYNGGDRPSMGYGAPRADGSFANQAYINNVLSNAQYFDSYLSPPPDSSSTDTAATIDSVTGATGDASTSIAGALFLGGAIAALVKYFRSRGR